MSGRWWAAALIACALALAPCIVGFDITSGNAHCGTALNRLANGSQVNNDYVDSQPGVYRSEADREAACWPAQRSRLWHSALLVGAIGVAASVADVWIARHTKVASTG